MSDDQFREKMREIASSSSSKTPTSIEDIWRRLRPWSLLHRRRRRRPECSTRTSPDALAEDRNRTPHRRQRALLPLHPAQPVRASRPRHSATPALAKGNGWRRLVVEKPFGHDLASARELSDRLHEVFDESDVYRIDHYLGKETVQNILAFRFGNGIFEPLWNRRYIDHVQITGAESIGVEGRGAYYQEAGALRDMIQNHLLQVMATVAMEPSATFRANSRPRRTRQAPPLHSHHDSPTRCSQNAVAGQYGPARIGGEDAPGFRQEKGVDPELADQHLRRRHLLRRQLALGRRAVLHPHRQAPAQARQRNRHSVQRGRPSHFVQPGFGGDRRRPIC